MDDTQQQQQSQQAAFANQYPAYGGFGDFDMMKRSMETAGGPDAKKARWSPTMNNNNNSGGVSPGGANPARDAAYANYGYGPGASHFNNAGAMNSPSAPSFGGQLYATPANGNGPQLSPNSAASFAQQQQANGGVPNGAPNGYAGMAGYNMLQMGMPGMAMLGGFPYSPAMGSFPQNFNPQQQRLPQLNIPAAQAAAQANYSPAALSAAINASSNATGRTVYVGSLPANAAVDELLSLVHFGPIESVRVLPEKSCVFLSFLDGATAAAFHADATIKKLALHGQELKIGWGKPSPVPSQVALSITQSNASRNVYIGGLDESMTEEELRDDLSRFGLIDQVKIVRDKNIGFVHFLSIAVATKVVATLPTEPKWAGKRVNYGKDRCAYVPKGQQAAAHAAQAAAAQSLVAQAGAAAAALSPLQTAGVGGFGAHGGQPYSPFTPFSPADVMSLASGQGSNRTVYLGNIHPETNTEDLCNAIRGGVLQSIRYMQDKHIAFVTFIDPAAALTFFHVATYQGLTLNNRRLKIGWGKNSGPLAPAIALAVHSGATRNIYIGNVEDFDKFSEDKLRRDFGEFGDIELVNFLKEKNCGFVNFTNISNAIKALDGIKNKPEYANLRVSYGKDRCANPPRSGPQGGSGARRSASGNAPQSAVEKESGELGELEGGEEAQEEGQESGGDTEMNVDVSAE